MSSPAPVGAPARARIPILVVLLLGAVASSCATQVSPSPANSPSPSALEPTPGGTATWAAPSSTAGSPTLGPCAATSMTVRVTGWTGAAGHRIATVELQNTGSQPCLLFALARPQLTDAAGAILIDGQPPGASPALEVAPGGTLTTEVQDSNYCGPDPAQPVTVAFVLPEGLGRVVAEPDSPDSLAGVPPCLGPGAPGTIEKQPWQP